MSITKKDIEKEFDKIDGRDGTYQMMIGDGERIVYQDGDWGTYWHTPTSCDQAPTWTGRDAALKKAFDYLVILNKLDSEGSGFEGFEKHYKNFWN